MRSDADDIFDVLCDKLLESGEDPHNWISKKMLAVPEQEVPEGLVSHRVKIHGEGKGLLKAEWPKPPTTIMSPGSWSSRMTESDVRVLHPRTAAYRAPGTLDGVTVRYIIDPVEMCLYSTDPPLLTSMALTNLMDTINPNWRQT